MGLRGPFHLQNFADGLKRRSICRCQLRYGLTLVVKHTIHAAGGQIGVMGYRHHLTPYLVFLTQEVPQSGGVSSIQCTERDLGHVAITVDHIAMEVRTDVIAISCRPLPTDKGCKFSGPVVGLRGRNRHLPCLTIDRFVNSIKTQLESVFTNECHGFNPGPGHINTATLSQQGGQ